MWYTLNSWCWNRSYFYITSFPFGWLLPGFLLTGYFSFCNRNPGTLCMQSVSVNMLNHCIDMLLVPLTRPCFWSCRTLSAWEMLVRSNKTLRTPCTLGTVWWSKGKIQSAGNLGVTLHHNLDSLLCTKRSQWGIPQPYWDPLHPRKGMGQYKLNTQKFRPQLCSGNNTSRGEHQTWHRVSLNPEG